MKQVFYKGLLALTIAFGMTSCDKNDVGEVNGPLTSVTKGITSKVSFGENGIGIAVKGKADPAGKTHIGFDHIYSSVPQSIAIADSDGAIVFRGSYEAANIVGGITADEGYAVPIILQNGSYRAETTNEGGEGIGYLPYSSAVDFDLDSDTGLITLVGSLQSGFLIVNVENAIEGQRVTSVTAGLEGASLDLINDTDGTNDFYGYLSAATYNVVANYDLDGTSTPVAGTQAIGNGSAYTLDLLLQASIVSTSETTLVPEASTEVVADLDVNLDGDKLDIISRVNSSTITTTGGVDGIAVIEEGVWGVTSDIDILVSSATVTGTEASLGDAGRDINTDGDIYDYLSREETTTVTSIDGVNQDDSDTANGAWSVISDRSEPAFGGGPNGPADSSVDPTDTFSAWSAWSPENADASEAMVVQTRTRTRVQNGDLDDPLPVGDLSQTQTVANPASVVDVADEYLSASSSASVGGVASTVNDGVAVVTLATAASGVASVTETTTQATLDNVSEIVVTTTTVYTIQINVREDVPALAAKDDLVETDNTPATSVAGTPVVTTREVANPDYSAPVEAAVWAAVDGVYSNSDFPRYTFTIDEDPLFATFGYILSTDGVAADAVIGEHDDAAAAIAAAIADIAAL